MPPTQPVTETVILHLKDVINRVEIMVSDPSASISRAVQAFDQLKRTVQAQPGFLYQYWGRQVEQQDKFVWSIDWESFEHITAFVSSEEHNSFMACMGQVFDLEAAAPLRMYTRFNSDATAAFRAPVTEVAFFTVPTSVREDAKTLIEEASTSGMEAVTTVGKSTGGAIGFVFDAKNASDAAPEGHLVALHGVFGYASVDDHVKWRATPEHAQVIEDIGRSPLAKLCLGNAKLPGGNIFVPDSSMFHVKFRAEAVKR